jgi:hypothetical protein
MIFTQNNRRVWLILAPIAIGIVSSGCSSAENGDLALPEAPKSRLVFDITLGQSLGINRVGPAPSGEEVWLATADYSQTDLSGIYSFDRIFAPGNRQAGIDVHLENIAGQSIQPVIDQAYGKTAKRDNVASSSPFISAALSYRKIRPGTDIHLTSLAMGGQELSFFTPDAETINEGGYETNWWNGAFSPTLNTLKTSVLSTDGTLGFDDVDTYFKWLQGEADHRAGRTRNAYRDALAEFHKDVLVTYRDIVGNADEETPLFLSYQMGRMYAPQRRNYPETSAAYRISEVTLGTLDLGLSNAPDMKNFISIPPSYAYTFSGISHMDQSGYHALQSMFGYVATQAEDARTSGNKWKPLHILPDASVSTNGMQITLPVHIPIDKAQLKIGVPDDEQFFSIPAKPDSGISLHCDGRVPDIKSTRIQQNAPAIIVELTEPWICKNRKVGIAYQGWNSYYQGWQRGGGRPDGTPYHSGVGSNIYIETDWTEPHSGKRHTIYASHQIIDIN